VVGEPREDDLAEIVAALPPGEMDEIAIGRQAEKLRVAVGELAVQLVEADDLGRADEGEILGPGEEDQPFPGIAGIGRRREGGLGSLPETAVRENSGSLSPTVNMMSPGFRLLTFNQMAAASRGDKMQIGIILF
jgi:hypothetical protein